MGSSTSEVSIGDRHGKCEDVQCWGYLVASDHQLYSYSTQDAVRIGNSFITILNHT
jgi:hypothetical protein